jgi:hypothetical protein
LSGVEVAALIPRDPILVCFRGSHSHGTYVPSTDEGGIDDIDIISCYIKPKLESYLGIEEIPKGHDCKIREWDSASYEIRHLAKLLSAANPNVLSMLWMDEYISLEPAGKDLIAMRDMFSTKQAGNSFTGYMYGQIKRMTSWHDTGESTCCDGTEFHTEDCKLRLERGRGSQKKFATGYMGDKRKALVQKFGYDAKNAAHAIRLGRMGIEFLSDGVLRVVRPDAAELIDIKSGKWPLEKVKAEADSLMSRLKDARDKSPLPEAPDLKAINTKICKIIVDHFGLFQTRGLGSFDSQFDRGLR